jgi:hypothetical protein
MWGKLGGRARRKIAGPRYFVPHFGLPVHVGLDLNFNHEKCERKFRLPRPLLAARVLRRKQH